MIARLKEEQNEPFLENHRVQVEPGKTYRFKGAAGKPDADGNPRWRFAPCRCFCVGVSRSIESLQEKVVFSPLSGPWKGELLSCTLLYWADNFEQPLLEERAEPTPERIPWDQVPSKTSGNVDPAWGRA